MFTYAGERILSVEPYPKTRCLCGKCDDLFHGAMILTESGRLLGVPFHWIEKHPDPPGWPEELARLMEDRAARRPGLRPRKPGSLRGMDGTSFLLDPITEAFAIMANALAQKGTVL